jgi:hypothetical protein
MKRIQSFRQRLALAVGYPGREKFYDPVMAAAATLRSIHAKAVAHSTAHPSPRAVFP